MSPLNVVAAVSLAVSAALPRVTLPAPVRLLAVWLKPFRSSVAPAATSIALLVAKLLAMPVRKVPALMSVAPV